MQVLNLIASLCLASRCYRKWYPDFWGFTVYISTRTM